MVPSSIRSVQTIGFEKGYLVQGETLLSLPEYNTRFSVAQMVPAGLPWGRIRGKRDPLSGGDFLYREDPSANLDPSADRRKVQTAVCFMSYRFSKNFSEVVI